MVNKISILGSPGSGKSYLAKEISKILKIQNYDLDYLFFASKFDKKRDEEERDKLFKKVCKKKKWIMEGAYTSWIEEGIKKSDLIVFLKTPPYISAYRTFKRFRRRKKEKAINDETWKGFFELLNFLRKYKKKNYSKGYYKHKEMVDRHKVDVVYLKNKKEINKFLEDIKK